LRLEKASRRNANPKKLAVPESGSVPFVEAAGTPLPPEIRQAKPRHYQFDGRVGREFTKKD